MSEERAVDKSAFSFPSFFHVLSPSGDEEKFGKIVCAFGGVLNRRRAIMEGSSVLGARACASF